METRKAPWRIIVIIVVLVAVPLIAWKVLAARSAKNGQTYQTAKIDRGDVTMTVTATGTLSAVTTVQIGSQVSGVIVHLYADFNSRVKKGQLLAELDPTPFQAQVEQRQADLTKARVDMRSAKISFDRQARLLEEGLAAQADYDGSKAQYDGAAAQVQQATAALSQTETNLRYTKIISPIDGIVVDRQYDVGQTVAASFQAPTLFSIAQDLTKMQVQADVDQSDIGRIAVEQIARFTVDSYPDQEFRGRISQIRLNATVAQNVVTYPVIIEVPNPDEKLRPKMTANVTIDVANVRDVLRVPNAALRFKPATPVGTGEKPAAGEAASGAPAGGQQGSGGRRGGGQSGGGAAGGAEGAAIRMGERGPGMTGAGAAFARSEKKRPQNVYLLQPDNKLKPVAIHTGITDGHFTQVVEGDLKPGDTIVVGLATSKVEGPAPPGSSNPMAPRGGGGGRGR
jgi:HlyD family secretion protein